MENVELTNEVSNLKQQTKEQEKRLELIEKEMRKRNQEKGAKDGFDTEIKHPYDIKQYGNSNTYRTGKSRRKKIRALFYLALFLPHALYKIWQPNRSGGIGETD
ncbi:hypothetical protein FQA39_LY11591 [Lamprigera yunnana]|nr:hypothetical protein FQA39_LY11591 [Lamprigera yunnana]